MLYVGVFRFLKGLYFYLRLLSPESGMILLELDLPLRLTFLKSWFYTVLIPLLP